MLPARICAAMGNGICGGEPFGCRAWAHDGYGRERPGHQFRQTRFANKNALADHRHELRQARREEDFIPHALLAVYK